MKIRTVIAMTAVGASWLAAAPVQATYTGLSVELHATVTAGGGPKSVWRVYANFTNPNDYFEVVVGSDSVGLLKIQSLGPDGNAPGGDFFDPGGASSKTAPSLAQINGNSDLEWGTFATAGVGIADQGSGDPDDPDITWLSIGFPNFITGNSLVSNNIGWQTLGPTEQGRAGYLGDGDAQLRVLIMQLTVNAGDHVKGTVTIGGINIGTLAAIFTATGQTFGSSIPGPAAFSLLALAGAVGTRSRRRGG